MKKLIFILSILALLNSCKRPLSPRDGDLLFCIADSSDFSRSIVESTRSHSELQFGFDPRLVHLFDPETENNLI